MKHLRKHNEEFKNPLGGVIKHFKDKIDAKKAEKERLADEEKKESERREKEKNKRISKYQNLINNKETLIDCFQDLIDISQDHSFTINKDSINLAFECKGIVVNSQSKSERNRQGSMHTRVSFDEAHLVITDELVDIMNALKEAKHLLSSIDDGIIMDTVFKKGVVRVYISIEGGNERYYTRRVFIGPHAADFGPG